MVDALVSGASVERRASSSLVVGTFAEIAQLVEHNLAKVGVASSSLVFRSSLNITIFAEIAQLVEHNLAKVGVASSSLVFRSKDCILQSFFLSNYFLFVILL